MGLEDELKEKIVVELGLDDDPAGIDEESPLFYEGLGLDSLDSLELLAIMRRDYGIEIQDRHAAREILASVRTMADCIRSQGATRAD